MVNLVPKLSLLDHNHPFVDAVLNVCTRLMLKVFFTLAFFYKVIVKHISYYEMLSNMQHSKQTLITLN
jgi:hypothetical protein